MILVLTDDMRCLTDPNQEKYDSAFILTQWESNFSSRVELLKKTERSQKVITVDKYLKSSKWKFPIGICLVNCFFYSIE